MTFGQLFTVMNPDVKVRENGNCMWLFFDEANNHYTIAAKWWKREIPDYAVELLKEQDPVKAVADGEDSYMCNNCGTVIGWAEWEPGGIEEVKYKFCPECGKAVKWDD